jgi:hypothetical protein
VLYRTNVHKDQNQGGKVFMKSKYDSTIIQPSLVDVISLNLGDRAYEIPSIIADGEIVGRNEILARIKREDAELGKDDGQWFKKYQDDIPMVLRERLVYIFTMWRHPEHPDFIALLFWGGDRLLQYWAAIGYDWNSRHRPVRRIQPFGKV